MIAISCMVVRKKDSNTKILKTTKIMTNLIKIQVIGAYAKTHKVVVTAKISSEAEVEAVVHSISNSTKTLNTSISKIGAADKFSTKPHKNKKVEHQIGAIINTKECQTKVKTTP